MAQLMTWRARLVNVPFGGSMIGIKCQPTELSMTEVESVTREFTQQIYDELGRNSKHFSTRFGNQCPGLYCYF